MPKAKRKSADKDLEKGSAKWFDDESTRFKGVLRHAWLISNKIGRHVATPPRGLATWLWLRAIITSQSIERLLTPHESVPGGAYLDHASIATLSRSLIENVAVMRYIGDDDISEDEWRCRHYIINMYDAVHRTEFLPL